MSDATNQSQTAEDQLVHSMEKIAGTSRWLERMGDYINPILVKETRRALKSRWIILAFTLMLVSSWGISVLFSLFSGDSLEYGAPSVTFFYAFYFVLAVAVFLVVPFSTFQSFQGEQDGKTFEALSISSLSPRQIVWGQLLTAMLQIFLYYCAISPFIAFTALLQGFDVLSMSYVLGATAVFSPLLCMTALMLSSMACKTNMRTIVMLAVLVGLFLLLMGALGLAASIISFGTMLSTNTFWLVTLIFVVVGLSYFFLFEQITIAQLTFYSGNRSTGIRIVGFVQLIMAWSVLLISFWNYSAWEPGAVLAISIVCAVHLAVFGVFMISGLNSLSNRIRRTLPKNKLLRLLSVPFLPGGTRGFLYIILQLAVMMVIVFIAKETFSVFSTPTGSGSRYVLSRTNILSLSTYGISAYIIFYLGLGCFTTRIFSKWIINARMAMGLAITLIFFAIGALGPYVLEAIRMFIFSQRRMIPDRSNDLLMTFNPFVSLEYIFDERNTALLPENFYPWVATFTVLLVVGIGLNFRSIIQSIQQVLVDPPMSQSKIRKGVEVDEKAEVLA